MAGKHHGTARWGDAAAIEAMLEDQEALEAIEAEEAAAAAKAAAEAAASGTPTVHTPGSGGNPEFGAFVPTDEQRAQVKNMARCGMPQDAMTLMVRWPNGRPISKVTLRRYFGEELITGHIEVGMQVFGSLYKKAMAGDTGAACFLLKTGYGFRETNYQEIAGKDGAPLAIGTGVIVVPGMANSDEWEKTVPSEQQRLAERAAEFMNASGEFAKPEGPLQ